ncbi:MAG: hypothetical protein FWH48_10490 [Oscillospiraceae bacterium]|nr:hypothetical protein [Oscillospiraceae bacterium]
MIKKVQIIENKNGEKLLHTTEFNGRQKLYAFLDDKFRQMVENAITKEAAKMLVVAGYITGRIRELKPRDLWNLMGKTTEERLLKAIFGGAEE